MKGLVILRIRTCLKNSLKIGFIAVDLTEVSSSTKIGNFHFFSNISAYYHISAILVVYLDGRLHALSFDILHATFLGYQVLVQICHSVTCVTVSGMHCILSSGLDCFPVEHNGFSARVLLENNPLLKTTESPQVGV